MAFIEKHVHTRKAPTRGFLMSNVSVIKYINSSSHAEEGNVLCKRKPASLPILLTFLKVLLHLDMTSCEKIACLF